MGPVHLNLKCSWPVNLIAKGSQSSSQLKADARQGVIQSGEQSLCWGSDMSLGLFMPQCLCQ